MVTMSTETEGMRNESAPRFLTLLELKPVDGLGDELVSSF